MLLLIHWCATDKTKAESTSANGALKKSLRNEPFGLSPRRGRLSASQRLLLFAAQALRQVRRSGELRRGLGQRQSQSSRSASIVSN